MMIFPIMVIYVTTLILITGDIYYFIYLRVRERKEADTKEEIEEYLKERTFSFKDLNLGLNFECLICKNNFLDES